MSESKCPYRGSQRFYVRDPDYRYEIFEFDLQGGKVKFRPEEEETLNPPDIGEETETYCGTCSWHGKFSTLSRL